MAEQLLELLAAQVLALQVEAQQKLKYFAGYDVFAGFDNKIRSFRVKIAVVNLRKHEYLIERLQQVLQKLLQYFRQKRLFFLLQNCLSLQQDVVQLGCICIYIKHHIRRNFVYELSEDCTVFGLGHHTFDALVLNFIFKLLIVHHQLIDFFVYYSQTIAHLHIQFLNVRA